MYKLIQKYFLFWKIVSLAVINISTSHFPKSYKKSSLRKFKCKILNTQNKKLFLKELQEKVQTSELLIYIYIYAESAAADAFAIWSTADLIALLI